MRLASLRNSPFSEQWRPKVIATLNGQEVELIKVQGTFPWHSHQNEDEMFLVWRGQFRVDSAKKKPRCCASNPLAFAIPGDVTDVTFTAPQSARI